MNIKRKILKWILIVFALIGLQTITYFTIGLRQIKNKLLPDYFSSLSNHSDSVYVCYFYKSDVNDLKTYLPNKFDEKVIKQKFNVNFVHFETLKETENNDSIKNKYNLVYNTWTTRFDWITLFYFYSATQTETLLADKKYFYKREAHYHWLLFFWIKTFEWFESTDMLKNTN